MKCILDLRVPGLTTATTTIAWCLGPDQATAVDTSGWTLTALGADEGRYVLDVPLALYGSTFEIYEDANRANYNTGELTLVTYPFVVPPTAFSTYQYQYTCLDVLRVALGQLRNLKPGEQIPPEETAVLVMMLNAMLASWAIEGFTIYAPTQETRALAAVESFTIGAGADQDSVRPSKVNPESFIRTSAGLDYAPLKILSLAEYNAITIKTTPGIPTQLYYDPAYPFGTVHLQSVPTSGLTLHLFSDKPFNSFEDENTPFPFPPEYLRCLGFNLAIDMAGPYNKALSPSTIAIAAQTKRTLKAVNASKNPIKRDFSGVPVGNGGGVSGRDPSSWFGF